MDCQQEQLFVSKNKNYLDWQEKSVSWWYSTNNSIYLVTTIPKGCTSIYCSHLRCSSPSKNVLKIRYVHVHFVEFPQRETFRRVDRTLCPTTSSLHFVRNLSLHFLCTSA